ncbi:MAG TPA: tRNA pseudouridine(54/55) synthase Pus10, partial [Thermoplasmata archaeon]|nr:tRNA pseudouridine(54/55) synthase Pus10 [Thermoplasmata archaeon]
MEDAVRRVVRRGLCDRCIGRPFGRAGHGMTNEERGRAIRFYVYGVEGVEVPAATGECPLCGGILSDLDRYADLVVGTMGNLDFSTFMVGSRFDDELIARERAL